MKKNLLKLGLGVLMLSLLLLVGFGSFAAQEGEFSRDLTVYGITVSVGNNTIENVYSDPAVYWEVANSGSLTDY